MQQRFHSYFNTAVQLISSYDGKMPLAAWLKNYFAANKKHGSKDRKYISHLCYCYYRLGQALPNVEVAEKLKVAIFLCNAEPGVWTGLFELEYIDNWNVELIRRIVFIQTKYAFSLEDVFPFAESLTDEIDKDSFIAGHFVQPDVFIRVRPGKEKTVTKKMEEAGLPFQQLTNDCIALPNASKIDTILALDKEAVIQDYSSQRIAEFFPSELTDKNITVWDCCSASGGKSILAYDHLHKMKLFASDVRSSILFNLQQRFAKAGIKNYHSFVCDISNELTESFTNDPVNFIICDAPCSGSGTWSRTPEQLAYFTRKKLEDYAALQKKIAGNAIKHLSKGGYFLYITCSVFKQENEEVVEFILDEVKGLKLIKSGALKGYNQKADSMHASLFLNQGDSFDTE
ncbi:methyltransferase domain-containing protein [Danxiaibacter flavus]|uniref:Methyltransferase domain-containing protein n=1 Tax=Danxiaibacter flavus TaxID=3049108 RepID=A0ABV3ZCH7_9BACT|nr:methyltransferase domain-containing protein [Chitinophagaceae bacterium DXS]